MMRSCAHVLRAVLLVTAAAVTIRGDGLYGLFCLAALGLSLVPAILARTTQVRAAAQLELWLLVLMVADMTLGNLLGLYARLPWFDKALHLGGSMLIALIGLLLVHALHAAGRTRSRPWLDGVAIVLLTLGLGALWEIAEYGVDRLLGTAAQRAPGMAPLDDTMLDLLMDGLGGVIVAALGPIYLRRSTRARQLVGELVALGTRRPALRPAPAILPLAARAARRAR
jgi:hypothetical protein